MLCRMLSGPIDTVSLLQEAATFADVNLYFHGSFNGEDHKATTLYMTLLSYSTTLVSYRLYLEQHLVELGISNTLIFQSSLRKPPSFFMMEQFPQIKFQPKSLLSRVKSTLQHFVLTLSETSQA